MTRELTIGSHALSKLTIEKILELAPNVEVLNFYSTKKVSQHLLKDLYRNKAPFLSSFKWTWCFDLREHVLIEFVKDRGATLKSLSLMKMECSTQVSDALFLALSEFCPELEEICIRGQITLSYSAVSKFCDSCPKLRKIELSTNGTFFSDRYRDHFKFSDESIQKMLTSVPDVNLFGYGLDTNNSKYRRYHD